MRKKLGLNSIVNILGAAGYALLLTVWVLFVAVALVVIMDPTMNSYPLESSYSPPASSSPSVLAIVAGYVIAIIGLILTLVVLVALPYFIGKLGSRIVRRVMHVFTIPMTRRQLFLTKSSIATLPLIGFMVINFILMPQSFTFAALYITTITLSVLSIGAFLMQLFVARRLKIPVERIW